MFTDTKRNVEKSLPSRIRYRLHAEQKNTHFFFHTLNTYNIFKPNNTDYNVRLVYLLI